MINKIHIEIQHKLMICNSQMDQKEKSWLIKITIKSVKKAEKKKWLFKKGVSVFCSYCIIV